jgi:predicted acyltransferase
MGVAVPFAFAKYLETGRPESPHAGSRGDGLGGLHRKIVRRTLILLVIGLLSGWFPFVGLDWSTARIPGVLQRIAFVYLFSSLAFLHLRTKGRAWLTAGLLAGYWLIMKLVPVPGFGAGDLSPEGNLAGHVDQLVFGSHVWVHAPGSGDPEGILSTIPAVATALIGIFVGEFLALARVHRKKIAGLFGSAAVGIAVGLVTAEWFPINKMLWTPSYVLLTAGMAVALLGCIYYVVDIKGHKRWAKPFHMFGMNSIATYVGSGLLARILLSIRWTGADGATVSLQRYLYETFVASVFPDYWASLAWALANVLVWLAIASLLFRKRIFIKI